MIRSRISSKAQTTVPRAVRTALGLREGDALRYEIDGNRVILTRGEEPDAFIGNFSAFTEWAGVADQAYDVLGSAAPKRGASRE